MEQAPLESLTLGTIVRQSFQRYGETLSTIVVLAVIAHAPLLLLTGLITDPQPQDILPAILLLVVVLAITGIVVNAICLAVLSAIVGRPAGVVQCLRWSLRRSSVAVMIGYMLTNFVSHLGLLLFIVPGMLAGGILAVTVPAIIVEGKGPLAGMGRSVALLRQNWIKGIGVFAFGTFISELLPLQVLFGMQVWVGQGPFSPVLAALLAAISLPLALIANLLLYLSLRAAEEPSGTEQQVRTELLKLLPVEE